MTIADDQNQKVILRDKSPFELRAMLEEMVINDLLGPAGGPWEEVDERNIRERYLIGMLAPRQQRVAPEEQDTLATDDGDSADEGATDAGALQAETFFPSSMGLTFTVAGSAPAIIVTARWGRYTRQDSEVLTSPKTGNALRVSKREPIEQMSPPIPLKDGDITPWAVTDEQPEVTVRGRVRRNAAGDWAVTLFLVNGQEELAKGAKAGRDSVWLFQAGLSITAPDGAAIFRKQMADTRNLDLLDPLTRAEQDAMGMLYRHQVEFATGHGVGVQVTADDPACPDCARRIDTTFLPSYEVPQTTPPTAEDFPKLAGLVLDMKLQAEAPVAELPSMLEALSAAYTAWIDEQKARIVAGADGLQPYEAAANAAITQCNRVLARIQDGITLLQENPDAAKAFQFANRAMWLQRTRSIYAKQVRKGKRQATSAITDIDIPANRTWYPFQLAFILLNLPSITDLHHPDRSNDAQAVADLLWFPTGGGKTEAYLGLAAYTMALRRLQGVVAGRSGEYGLAVLMRYTLRLLTLQQFQRATTLICACEIIRREHPATWGDEPFRIGLWVGMRATPNTTEQADEIIDDIRKGNFVTAHGTPAQLTTCPWCGREIRPGKHIDVYAGASNWNRTTIYCGDDMGRCPFSKAKAPVEGIPALVVDEEIYRHPPTLLIATVDKFAQMPWKGEVQMLFGQVTAKCERHGFISPELPDTASGKHARSGNLPQAQISPHAPLRPPDLIIQDELHLISGPLGSLVGLYETAVDELMSWKIDGKQIRPKVIASTATIRRASDQVNRLFLRRLEVFPPHGTDIGDNFFSMQRTPSEKTPGRRYLGLCAFGRRYPAALIRLHVAIMAAAQKLYEDYDAAVDPWMTVIGYYNSLRELGGGRRLVEDDISTRLQRHIDKRGLALRRRVIVEELTSRKSGVDIPKILDRLEIGFKQEDDAKRKAKEQDAPPYPYDVVLATNMISVGVDVDRLGLMVVAGQPKNTAEYIQATSRVGRKSPGLVFTLYNWARPRDLSHFERFEHYHATFYQHVEALSVTPFAMRALDRGLSAVMVSLIRLASDQLNENTQAMVLTADHPLVQHAFERIVHRAEMIMGSKAVGDEVRAMLEMRRDHWLTEIAHSLGSRLGYRDDSRNAVVGLLHRPGATRWDLFTCLNALRDVEPPVNLILNKDRSHGLEAYAEPGGVSPVPVIPPPPETPVTDTDTADANEEGSHE